MNTQRKAVLAAMAGAALIAASGAAMARDNISFSISLGVPARVYAPPVVAYYPQVPVYVPPPRVYYAPAYVPPPVVYYPAGPRWRHRHWDRRHDWR